MKIFQVSEYISSAFDSLLNENQKKDIYNCLELLYINNHINDEILLNMMKAFIVIFYNNSNDCSLYCNLFNNLSKEETIKIFNLIKKIKFSNQLNIDEIIINKIILTINNYININKKINSFNLLLTLYNIYDTIRLNKKISLNNKIQLYIILLRNNSNLLEVRQSIAMINKF
jgi:hypothetical protein